MEPRSQLRGVTCHMGSHSATFHLTQVNTPCLNPSQTGWYLIYLPLRDGRLSWLTLQIAVVVTLINMGTVVTFYFIIIL